MVRLVADDTEATVAASMKELFEIVDRKDSEEFAALFTPDGKFRFGNSPTVTGRDAIASTVGEFFGALESLHHEILDVWEEDGVVICEVEVVYRRKDGHEVLLPAATIGRKENDLLRDYRIYMDVNPLFA